MPEVPEKLLIDAVEALEDEAVERDRERGECRTIEELRVAGLTPIVDALRVILESSLRTGEVIINRDGEVIAKGR